MLICWLLTRIFLRRENQLRGVNSTFKPNDKKVAVSVLFLSKEGNYILGY